MRINVEDRLITNVRQANLHIVQYVKVEKLAQLFQKKSNILYEEKVEGKGLSIVITNANPYGESKAFKEAAKFLAKEDVDLVILDCIGFVPKVKELFKRLTDKPVLLPQTLLGSLLKVDFS